MNKYPCTFQTTACMHLTLWRGRNDVVLKYEVLSIPRMLSRPPLVSTVVVLLTYVSDGRSQDGQGYSTQGLSNIHRLQSVYPQYVPIGGCPCDTVEQKCQVKCCCDPVRYILWSTFVEEMGLCASYFHKGLMWRGVKVEKSRKNGFSYDKAIFWQNL